MTAERKAAAITKRQEKEANKVQKAIQLQAQRTSKVQARAEKKKQPAKRKNELKKFPDHWFDENNDDGVDKIYESSTEINLNKKSTHIEARIESSTKFNEGDEDEKEELPTDLNVNNNIVDDTSMKENTESTNEVSNQIDHIMI